MISCKSKANIEIFFNNTLRIRRFLQNRYILLIIKFQSSNFSTQKRDPQCNKYQQTKYKINITQQPNNNQPITQNPNIRTFDIQVPRRLLQIQEKSTPELETMLQELNSIDPKNRETNSTIYIIKKQLKLRSAMVNAQTQTRKLQEEQKRLSYISSYLSSNRIQLSILRKPLHQIGPVLLLGIFVTVLGFLNLVRCYFSDDIQIWWTIAYVLQYFCVIMAVIQTVKDRKQKKKNLKEKLDWIKKVKEEIKHDLT